MTSPPPFMLPPPGAAPPRQTMIMQPPMGGPPPGYDVMGAANVPPAYGYNLQSDGPAMGMHHEHADPRKIKLTGRMAAALGFAILFLGMCIGGFFVYQLRHVIEALIQVGIEAWNS